MNELDRILLFASHSENLQCVRDPRVYKNSKNHFSLEMMMIDNDLTKNSAIIITEN